MSMTPAEQRAKKYAQTLVWNWGHNPTMLRQKIAALHLRLEQAKEEAAEWKRMYYDRVA